MARFHLPLVVKKKYWNGYALLENTVKRFESDSLQDYNIFSMVYQIIDIFTSTKGGVRMKMPSVNSQNVSHFISASSSPTPCLLMATQPHI